MLTKAQLQIAKALRDNRPDRDGINRFFQWISDVQSITSMYARKVNFDVNRFYKECGVIE